MPELPDLEYIVDRLRPRLLGQRIQAVDVQNPIVLRVAVPGDFSQVLQGAVFTNLRRHGAFLHFALDSWDLVIHCMLAGRLQLSERGAKPLPHRCFSLTLDEGSRLTYGDDKQMGKVYLLSRGNFSPIPGFAPLGMDVLDPRFTEGHFLALIRKSRKQVRVFLMDNSLISSVGNAYADEILFAAGIHPKTLCTQLDESKRSALYRAVCETIRWGIDAVFAANQPTEIKVREHMRVRNRKNQPCPICGTTIRSAHIYGHDSYFCPSCQPTTRSNTIDWRNLSNER